jgi:GT2 family glycosyltransferase
MENEIHFAAFIMTYKRVSVLESTIEKLFKQSLPPVKVLIIDNDPEKSASVLVDKLFNLPLEYFAVGYNSGPAGAAKYGLNVLTQQNYDWIGWIDDDDPPLFPDVFEILLQIAVNEPNCGCVGAVGQYYNKNSGKIIRVKNEELEGNGSLKVDNIAGGMSKIVNSKVCTESHIFPDESLFYGFEELDFDIRLQNAGYELLVDKQLYKKHRLYYNTLNKKKERGSRKANDKIWREYYSTRNSLIIQFKNKNYKVIIQSYFRFMLKIINGFRFGIQYGINNAKMILLGIIHFLLNKRGFRNSK